MRHQRRLRSTLHGVELDEGDELLIRRRDRSTVALRLLGTGADLVSTTLPTDRLPLEEQKGAVTNWRIWCLLEVDGTETVRLERRASFADTFSEPATIRGIHVWFDACSDLFRFLRDTHGGCAPTRQCRLAIWEADSSIAPEPLHPWCPLPHGRVRVEDCYNGEDVWMGAYYGASAHGGLDINHPPGTPIWAPIAFHDQAFINSLADGHNNNRHRGQHQWDDGASWVLGCHHMTRLTVDEHTPVAKGACYASGAGVLSGSHHHSHFTFRVRDVFGEVLLDPWLVFRQVLRDRIPEPETVIPPGP